MIRLLGPRDSLWVPGCHGVHYLYTSVPGFSLWGFFTSHFTFRYTLDATL